MRPSGTTAPDFPVADIPHGPDRLHPFRHPLEGAPPLAVALHRFGTWLDAEIGGLEDLFDISGHEDAIDAIEVLHDLHLHADAGPEDIRRLLEGSMSSLAPLLARLRSIPRAGPADPLLDAWVRRAEVRLAETGAAVGRALAA